MMVRAASSTRRAAPRAPLAIAAACAAMVSGARAQPATERLGAVLPAHAPPAARRFWAAHQSGLCVIATRAAERRFGLAPGSLGAISRVETGRPMPVTGEVQPWPWTVNVAGVGHWYDTRAEAARAAAGFLARPDRPDVDVGCMQVSMRFHRDAFADLAAALDPAANVEVGARLLSRLASGRGLAAATGLYHSGTPAYGDPYRDGVAAMRRTQRDTLADAAGARVGGTRRGRVPAPGDAAAAAAIDPAAGPDPAFEAPTPVP